MAYTVDQIAQARQNLTVAVLHLAGQTAVEVGFGWQPVADAPSTFLDVEFAAAHSVVTGEDFPVWDGASDDCIYTSPEGNYAFRFWHDITHAKLGLGFGADDERQVALHQLHELAQLGFGDGTLEAELFWADTIGQTEFAEQVGGFVSNQLAFVLAVVNHGLFEAIDAERFVAACS